MASIVSCGVLLVLVSFAKEQENGKFLSYDHCKTFCAIFFLCWLYKETESASTKYNASDIDLLLSCHILVILSKLFFQMWIRETSRWLKRKKGKARHPFKFFWWGLSTDERFLLFRSCNFLVFELFEYWGSCTCYSRKHFPPTVPPMLRFKYGLHLSY